MLCMWKRGKNEKEKREENTTGNTGFFWVVFWAVLFAQHNKTKFLVEAIECVIFSAVWCNKCWNLYQSIIINIGRRGELELKAVLV